MIYLDASFVFSLHFRDSNSVRAMQLVGSVAESLIVSALCETETVNAFALRVFRNEMSILNMVNAVRDLESDLRAGILQRMPMPEAAFPRAKALAQTITPLVGVRAANLLHVAAAFELGAKSLYTFDQKQHLAARTAGLEVNQLP